jgi:hypothetical protein
MDRSVRVSCTGATSARLVTPPAHSDVTNVAAGFSGLTFDARPHADAPREEEAVFELTGHEGSAEQRVRLEVLPNDRNSAPVCWGDRAAMRSDGTGPVEVSVNPYCWDFDGDDFVIEGGGPGVHLDLPRHVPAGEGGSGSRYRTATYSGSETTTVWATDSLGARSADAEVQVTVGPNVDRPPRCTPSSYSTADVIAVNTRPGQVRRFALICVDLDGDPFVSHLSSPPARGALALVEGPPTAGYSAFERWSDATYVPTDDSLEPDPFSVTATGTAGDGPEARMAMVPRALPYNGGGGCGWSPAEAVSPAPAVLHVSCDDDEGDPLTAEVVTAPHHGTLTPAVVTPSAYGEQAITSTYVPEPGYEGYDCVQLRIADGHGLEFKISVDIWVRPPVKVEPPDLPELPQLPEVPELPSTPELPHVSPVVPPPTVTVPLGASGTPLRRLVEKVLGTRSVKRVKSFAGAQVWARTKLSRSGLLRLGEAPGLVVVCAGRCRVQADSVLAGGATPIRSSRRKSVVAVTPGQPQVLALTLGDAERLRLRGLRKPAARFTVSIRRAGAAAKTLKRSIPIGG